MDLRGLLDVALALVIVWGAFVGLLWLVRPRDVRLRELVRVVPDVVRLVRDLIREPSTPPAVRIILVGLLGWFVSPIDLIPEFVPVLGPLDDIVVAVLVLRWVRRQLGEDELKARWRGTDDGFRLFASVLGGR